MSNAMSLSSRSQPIVRNKLHHTWFAPQTGSTMTPGNSHVQNVEMINFPFCITTTIMFTQHYVRPFLAFGCNQITFDKVISNDAGVLVNQTVPDQDASIKIKTAIRTITNLYHGISIELLRLLFVLWSYTKGSFVNITVSVVMAVHDKRAYDLNSKPHVLLRYHGLVKFI